MARAALMLLLVIYENLLLKIGDQNWSLIFSGRRGRVQSLAIFSHFA
jgi:hypothetical protein